MPKKILPRLELVRQDNRPGRYPTTLKTGDTRLGNANSFFNDTKTVIFSSGSGVTVSYPTLIQQGSFLLNDGSLTSSIFVPGVSRRSVADYWREPDVQEERLTPFVEHGLHEQDLDKTGSYYLTGSHFSDVGLGFATPMGSKTILRLKLPVNVQTSFLATSASVYYYNARHALFEPIATPNDNVFPAPGKSFKGSDSILFSPFGTPVANGTLIKLSGYNNYVTASFDTDPNDGLHANEPHGVMSMMRVPFTGSLLTTSSFKATVSQSIDLSNYITAPFLIERAVFEIPIQAGSGWFHDKTRALEGESNLASGTIDFGGPAVTIGLLNNFRAETDLVLSASFIPSNDNLFRLGHNREINQKLRHGEGFLGYGTPAGVVPCPAESVYTGSVRCITETGVANGVIAVGSHVNPHVAPIVLIKPFGRSMQIKPSGRSIFGKEFVMGDKTQHVARTAKLSASSDVQDTSTLKSAVFVYKNAISPYLVFPTDKLTIAIAKHRPVMINPSIDVSLSQSLLTGSHDILLDAGNLNITLYGSLIRQNVEFHDTLNQNLTSNAVHQSIGFDPVLDQWQVDYQTSYTGSYIDCIVTGSMLSGSGAVRGNYRGTIASHVSSSGDFLKSDLMSVRSIPKYELSAFLKGVQCISSNERFFDTLLPAANDLTYLNGGNILKDVLPSSADVAIINIDTTQASIVDENLVDFVWSKSFPFQPNYNHLQRFTEPLRKIIVKKIYSGSTTTNINRNFSNGRIAISYFRTDVPGQDYGLLLDRNVRQNTEVPALTNDLLRFYYGFGDVNTIHTGSNGNISGSTNFPDTRVITGLTQNRAGVIIRGWKYGIINAIPTYTKAIYRHDRYGQFRDMLEQRLDSKFYETIGFKVDGSTGGQVGPIAGPVQVRFVNSATGELVSPSRTNSSNLHFEVTSSLPYFADEVRNRENPLNLANVGSTVVSLTSDNFGNLRF